MKQVLPAHLRQAEFARTGYSIKAAAGATLDDVLARKFWHHVEEKLVWGDRVEVIAEDGSFYADFLVIGAVGRKDGIRVGRLKLALISKVEMSDALVDVVDPVASKSDQYIVAFAGKARWRVVRAQDNTVMVSDLPTRGDAEAWVAAQKEVA